MFQLFQTMSVDSSESASASEGVYDDLEYLNLIFQVFQLKGKIIMFCLILIFLMFPMEQERRGSDTEQSNLDHQSSSSMESNLEVLMILGINTNLNDLQSNMEVFEENPSAFQ